MIVLFASAVVRPVDGAINLEWRPVSQTVQVGVTVTLGLYVVSDSAEPQSLSSVRVVFSWNPIHLRLLGLDPTGGAPLASSGFPGSGDCGLNEVVPPQDGDGSYNGGTLGSPVDATPEGTLLTTFQFEALAITDVATDIEMLESDGSGDCRTVVIDGVIPGLDVLGQHQGATVTITHSGQIPTISAWGTVIMTLFVLTAGTVIMIQCRCCADFSEADRACSA